MDATLELRWVYRDPLARRICESRGHAVAGQAVLRPHRSGGRQGGNEGQRGKERDCRMS
jgi:hypothetical protein